MVGSATLSAKFAGKSLEEISKSNNVADSDMVDVIGHSETVKLNESKTLAAGTVAPEEPKTTTSSKKKKKKGKK